MPASPFVSVVIPAYAPGPLLAQTVESVGAQVHRPVEIVIADDGSPEAIRAPACGDIPVTVLRLPHRGPSAARNAGLRAARGDHVAFLDADDLWTPDALRMLLDGFAAMTKADAIHGLVQSFKRDAAGAETRPHAPHFGFNLGSILFTRAALARVGEFDEARTFSEDVDFLVRFKECGAQRHTIPRLVLLYRRGHGSLTERSGLDRDGRGAVRQWAHVLAANLKRRRAAGGGT